MSKIKKILERVIYVNCIILAMSNNITILDDIKHGTIVDNPLIDILRGLPSMTQDSKEILKIIVSFGGGQ